MTHNPRVSPRGRLSGRLLLAVCVSIALVACAGDDGGPACVEQLCDPAEFGTRCHHNSLWRCASDGRSYTFTACNSQERCDDASGAARCAIRACSNPGVATCLNPTERELCLPDASARERELCEAGTSCRDGLCVPTDCTQGQDTCTNNGFLRCELAQWVSTTCPTGQVCRQTGGTLSCGAPICVPNTSRCEDRQVFTCDALGASETVTPCADGQTCLSGICQEPVCGEGPGTDATNPTDTSVGAAEIRFSVNGVVQTLTLNAQAVYTEVGRRLTISGMRASRRLEIRLAPIARLETGAWDSEIFSPTQVTVCYTEGTDGAGVGDCPAPFTHRESTYAVSITRNDGVGTRVEGTFDVTLRNINRDPLVLQDGSFSVNHR